jgi:predicted DNA binding CopG/RHH family protein
MKKKRKKTYTDEPMKLGKRVTDFLPPPSQLVAKEDNVRVTLFLSRESLTFFKHEAEENKVPYQKMIRAVLDEYSSVHGE